MTIRQWQRLGFKTVLGGLLAWSGHSTLSAQAPMGRSAAQDTAQVQRTYMSKGVVDLPITMDAGQRQQIKEIQLYVKEKGEAQWVIRDKALPSQGNFRFQAPHDGEYWFAMATIDRQGRSSTPDLQHEPPGLILVIDTQKPAVELTNLGTCPEGQLIHCDVRDVNLDIAGTRFYYQSGDKQFHALEMTPDRYGIFCIPTQAVFTGMVRLVAQDLAGNQTVCEEHLSRLKSRGPAPVTQPVAVNPAPPPGASPPGDLKKPNPLPPGMRGSETVDPVEPRPSHKPPVSADDPPKTIALRPDGSQGPRWENETPNNLPLLITPPAVEYPKTPTPTAAQKNSPTAKRQIVNSAKVFLDYQVENSDQVSIGTVEVWVTRDQAKSWEKITEGEQGKSPLAVELPGDGLFGLILLVPSKRGGSVAPPVGEQPDWWIEVDTTRPIAQITEVTVTHDKGQATVHITWLAQDRNLGDSPVDLFYAATPKGPWLPIAKGLRAAGQHQWRPPVEIGAQAHLQVIARDVAGNTGFFSTPEPISLEDPSRPRVTIRNVRPDASPVAPAPLQIIPASK